MFTDAATLTGADTILDSGPMVVDGTTTRGTVPSPAMLAARPHPEGT